MQKIADEIVVFTWEASMCWDRWKGKELGALPTPCADRPAFSKPLVPDSDARKCPMPMPENAPGAIANWPGWINRGWPAFNGLKNCWLCRPERARLWKCAALNGEGPSVCTISGERLSFTPTGRPLSVSFLKDSVSFRCLFCDLSFSGFLLLSSELLCFRDSRCSCSSGGRALSFTLSHLGLCEDGGRGPG